MIVEKNGNFLLLDQDSKKTLGTHSTFQKALKQEYAIAKNQGKSKEEIKKLINVEVKRNYSKHAGARTNGYVALKVLPTDAKMLSNILKGIGIKDTIPPNEMHMTLMYDEGNQPRRYKISNKSYKAKIVDCEILGKKGSEWEAVVIKLHSPGIEKRFHDLEAQGYKHSYDSLVQHVSLKYKPDKGDLAIIKRAIMLLKKEKPEISLNKEYTEALNDDKASEKTAGLILNKKEGNNMSEILKRIATDSVIASNVKIARKLTAIGRKHIAKGNFALPGRRYPIHDRAHARAALSMVARFGSPSEKAQVRAAVHAKYPELGVKKTAGAPPMPQAAKPVTPPKPAIPARPAMPPQAPVNAGSLANTRPIQPTVNSQTLPLNAPQGIVQGALAPTKPVNMTGNMAAALQAQGQNPWGWLRNGAGEWQKVNPTPIAGIRG